MDDEGLKTAYQEADRHLWKKEDLIAYDNASIREQDERGSLELAEERGMERGVELGMERAREKAEEEKAQNIRALYANGVPFGVLATTFNKTEAEIQ